MLKLKNNIYIFLLSKDNPSLAKAEVLSLIKAQGFSLIQNLLLVKTDSIDIKELTKISQRLSYTHCVYPLLFKTNQRRLLKDMERFDWDTIYQGNFSLRILNISRKKIPYKEGFLAGYIWKKLKKPVVNLDKPRTPIKLIFTDKAVFVCLEVFEVPKDFMQRRAHLKPALHPTSLHPKLARAMINLTGIKLGEVLVDPFCGVGGILVEAGLMGLQFRGYDIDTDMLKKAEINLKHYKIENYSLEKEDSTKIRQTWDYVVTDLPYAKNTKKQDLNILYNAFLKNLRINLRRKAVIGFPDFIDYRKYIGKKRLRIENEFNYYLHRSLTKKIVILTA